MDRLKVLWDYQTAESELEKYERSLKNTDTHKKLIREKQIFTKNHQKLQQYEKEAVILNNKIGELSARIDVLQAQMNEKREEIGEVAGYDLEDMSVDDIREMLKECEDNKSAIETDKRKLADHLKTIEKSENDIKDTMQKMRAAKRRFDKLKQQYEKELSEKKGDLDELRMRVKKAGENIDPKLMQQYKSIKQHRANPVAKLVGDRCEGCKMQLPSGTLQSLRAAADIVECENCGRILYVSED